MEHNPRPGSQGAGGHGGARGRRMGPEGAARPALPF